MSLNNVLIFGDSYSTFEGYIPQGYAPYYSANESPDTDVRRVTETWWHMLVSETDSKLILNNSWSGSTIGYTGYNNSDCSKSSSFIYRLEKLKSEGFFEQNKIDTVFIFGGTNDSWSNAPLGTAKSENIESSDLYSVLPAVFHFLKSVKKALPNADIYCLINTEIKPEIADCMKEACQKYGIAEIGFEHIDKRCGHPTVQGMKDIKNRILEVIEP